MLEGLAVPHGASLEGPGLAALTRWAAREGFLNITNHRNYNTVNNDIDSPLFMTFAGGQSRAFNFRFRWLGKI